MHSNWKYYYYYHFYKYFNKITCYKGVLVLRSIKRVIIITLQKPKYPKILILKNIREDWWSITNTTNDTFCLYSQIRQENHSYKNNSHDKLEESKLWTYNIACWEVPDGVLSSEGDGAKHDEHQDEVGEDVMVDEFVASHANPGVEAGGTESTGDRVVWRNINRTPCWTRVVRVTFKMESLIDYRIDTLTMTSTGALKLSCSLTYRML